MKKSLIPLLCAATIFLSACAAPPPKITPEQIAAQQRAAQELKNSIAAITKVEIFYPVEYRYEVVLARLASSGGSGFGLVGALVNLAVDASQKGNYLLRSDEFTQKVKALPDYSDIATSTVKKTAELLTQTGREVKISQMPAVKDDAVLILPKDVFATQEFGVLLIRPLHDLIAIDAYSSYKPTVTYEFKLQDSSGKVVWTDKVSQRREDIAYTTYSNLLEKTADAFSVLQKMSEAVPFEMLKKLNSAGADQTK